LGFCLRVIANEKPLNLEKTTFSVLTVLLLIYNFNNSSELNFQFYRRSAVFVKPEKSAKILLKQSAVSQNVIEDGNKSTNSRKLKMGINPPIQENMPTIQGKE